MTGSAALFGLVCDLHHNDMLVYNQSVITSEIIDNVCGVVGLWSPNSVAAPGVTAAMARSLAHRGPDDYGLMSLDDSRLELGHRRLSILDLSPLGHQPMVSADGRYCVVYNGEIYNFRELRRQLQGCGHAFRSDSDTEVLLAAFVEWGLACIDRFRGMFAFAIWDSATRELHLCRDRFGVKPLFYSLSRGSLAFGSEIRALHVAGDTGNDVSPFAVAEYIQYGYTSAPRSIFAAVRSVLPGTVVTFRQDLVPHETRYWGLNDLFVGSDALRLRVELSALSDSALLDYVEASLAEAFRYRMVADVPVGIFLSGGIDSSLLTAVLARQSTTRLRTFTIGYGGSEFDETPYARMVATHLGTEHTEFIVSPSEMLGLFERTREASDEPIGDSSLIPTTMVCQLARQQVKVALSADGADELFGGYARYDICGSHVRRLGTLKGAFQWLGAELLDRLPASVIAAGYTALLQRGQRYAGISDKVRKFVRMSRAHSPFDAYEAAISEWDPSALTRFGVPTSDVHREALSVFNEGSIHDFADRCMRFDAARYLPGDLLTKVDRASMAASLEAREPFLDHELARIAAALPSKWKIRGGQNKYVLRRLLDRHFAPGAFDRPKHGFSAPVGEWLKGPLRELLREELSASRVKQFGLLDPIAVERSVHGFLGGSGEASAAGIWILLQLQRWAGRWLNSGASDAMSASAAPRMVAE